jgi:lysophospholipase L1-like esterase
MPTWVATVTDNFTRADSTTVGNGWTPFNAVTNWKIASNKLVFTSDGPNDYVAKMLTRPSSETTGVDERVVITRVLGAQPYHSAIALRVQTIAGQHFGDYYLVQYEETTGIVQVYAVTNGGSVIGLTLTGSASGVQTAGHTYTLDATAVGVNPTVITITATDTTSGAFSSSYSVSNSEATLQVSGLAGVSANIGSTVGNNIAYSIVSVYNDTTSPTLAIGSLTATPGATTIALSTGAASGGTAPYTYKFYRSATSGSLGTLVSTGSVTTYTDTPPDGAIYYYTATVTDNVAAVATGAQISSQRTTGTTLAIGALTATAGINTIALSVVAPSGGTGSYTIKFYRSLTSQSGKGTQISSGTVTTYTDTPPDGKVYYYRADVTDAAAANVVSAQKPGQLAPNYLLCSLGDSITNGTGASVQANGYAYQLATIVARLLSPATVSSSVFGVGGSQSQDWITGQPNLANAITQFKTAASAAASGTKVYVTIMLGTNDSRNAITPAQYKINITNTIAAIRGATIVGLTGIFLLKASWVDPSVSGASSSGYTDASNGVLYSFFPQLDSLANGTTVFTSTERPYNLTSSTPTLLADGIHPNDTGHLGVANEVSIVIANQISGLTVTVPASPIPNGSRFFSNT